MSPAERLALVIAVGAAVTAALWAIATAISRRAELRQGRRLDRSGGGR